VFPNWLTLEWQSIDEHKLIVDALVDEKAVEMNEIFQV
jgi:hypothetical protein